MWVQPTGFVLLPLGAAHGRGELGVLGETIEAVPVTPVVRVAAVPDAFPAVGARQGQRRALRGQGSQVDVAMGMDAPHTCTQRHTYTKRLRRSIGKI